MRVLLDTDVILDIVLAREPFVGDAVGLWLAHERGRLRAYLAPITLVNVFYVVRKYRDITVARQAVMDLLAALHVCYVDFEVLQVAATLPLTDFEDAVQAATAQAAGIEVIVTRNLADYADSPVPALSPSDLMQRLGTS